MFKRRGPIRQLASVSVRSWPELYLPEQMHSVVGRGVRAEITVSGSAPETLLVGSASWVQKRFNLNFLAMKVASRIL